MNPPPRKLTRTLCRRSFSLGMSALLLEVAPPGMTIEARQINGQSVRDQAGEHFHDRGRRIAIRPAGRDGDMRSSAEYLTDKSGARRSWTNFQKEADTVVISTFDDAGKSIGPSAWAVMASAADWRSSG